MTPEQCAFREVMRQKYPDAFLRIQKDAKHGITSHFHHLIDPAHADYNKPYKIFKGGRGGMRTTTLSRCLVDIMASRKVRVCASRVFEKSIKESSKTAIENQIYALGLENRFEIKERTIQSDLGSECFFVGLERNTDNIKSLEDVDILWAEEARGLKKKTIQKMIPTLRKDGHSIWLSYNPELRDDPVEEIPKIYHDQCAVRITHYTDNPWIDESFVQTAERMKAYNYPAYERIYLGGYSEFTESSILGNLVKSYTFEVDEQYGDPMIGIDWGFSRSPTVVVECYLKGRSLFVRRSASKVGLRLDDTAGWLIAKVPNIRHYTSWADSEAPQTIDKVRNDINLIRSVAKPAGSVEEGVKFLQSLEEIVIHPECEYDTADEVKAYSFKVDKNDEITNIIVKDHDHYVDAIRYALVKEIIKGTTHFAIAS